MNMHISCIYKINDSLQDIYYESRLNQVDVDRRLAPYPCILYYTLYTHLCIFITLGLVLMKYTIGK